MELLETSIQIEKKINELEDLKKLYPSLIEAAVNARVEYDKALAMKIAILKEQNPVTIIEKLAKGSIWEHTYAVETAELKLKAHESNIKTTTAQLNGYQSINRHFSET